MDTTDWEIQFDSQGCCHHCTKYLATLARRISPEESFRRLQAILKTIKEEGRNKPYDCIIGVSGGVDSTFVAYQVRQFGLRPLAVHLDNGWNSELAVSNIEKTLKKLNIELHTHVLDWREFRSLQLSFLDASIPGMEIPTDHAILGIMNDVAHKYGIRYIISGAVAQRDWLLVRNVHRQFRNTSLRNYPHLTWSRMFWQKLASRLQVINILDYISYNKREAMDTISTEIGWKYYGGKHYESIYTRFIQGYILPRKFNIDKRKAHFSTLICSGQLSRSDALTELSHPAYPEELFRKDFGFVLKKLEMKPEEFDRMMSAPTRTYKAYRGYFNHWLYPSIYRTALKINAGLKRTGFYGRNEKGGVRELIQG
jgi:N-acetyl sugar amidotransferase